MNHLTPKFSTEIKNLYTSPKYSFLEKYKEILGENLNINDIVGEGTQAIIMRHPNDASQVIKIAKPGDVDDLKQEFIHHQLFYNIWTECIKNGTISTNIKIPQLYTGASGNYLIMERIDGQSLYSKTFIERFSHKFSPEEKAHILSLDDAQVREYLKQKYNENDTSLNHILDNYSVEHLMELLGNTYKIRRETGKIGGTPLDMALKVLKENGIAHNDLHPGNIMIDRNGNIYIIDFGRIKTFPPTHRSKNTHAIDEMNPEKYFAIGDETRNIAGKVGDIL